MFLREITLRNLLSFGPETPPFALRNLNVLIGPNGSGKSNFIEAIGLLRATAGDLSKPFSDGVGEWIWKGMPGGFAQIEVEVRQPEAPKLARHAFAFEERMDRLNIVNEEISAFSPGGWRAELYSNEGRLTIPEAAGGAAGFFMRHFDAGQSVLSQIGVYDPLAVALGHSRANLLELINLERSYREIKIFREWSFGARSPVRQFQRADQKGEFPSEDFENLGLVLNRLRHTPAVKRRILESLHDLYDGITDFDVSVFGGMFRLYLEEGDRSIPAFRLSDGTLRYLCLLAILCHPEPPPLICIEEPELGLHPDVLVNLAKLIKEASERTQLIITTHSEILVDALTYSPEDVVICEKGESGTVMRRLDPDDLEVWLEDYTLGQLWSRGQIGGNRW
ncbi:AAA family ATPase [Tautonia rosea]|uniref:AAA family ATPase n=1 Tax=Tautonia rosea TaxID=2728037 RepID=UPI00147447D3|nr:AAA family ATPase [Tautonia rosea]